MLVDVQQSPKEGSGTLQSENTEQSSELGGNTSETETGKGNIHCKISFKKY